MSEQKKRMHVSEEGEDESESIWLVTYADFMNTIACFFILLVGMANFDSPGFSEKAKELSETLRGTPLAESEVKMNQLQQKILGNPQLEKMTSMSANSDTLTIVLNGTILFPNNEIDLTPEIITQLDSLIDLIKTHNPSFRIFIEGHTDNTPLASNLPFHNQWALAAARASSIAERFQYFGFSSDNIRVVSYGDARPLKDNQDSNGKPIPANNLLNRRVVIKVVQPTDKNPISKLGLGVYFD